MEIFKAIKNCSNYQISNLGRILNIKRNIYMKPYLSRKYLKIDLINDQKNKIKCHVHRLVLDNFIGEEPYLCVNHINHIPTDNRLENLEWVTTKENNIKRRTQKNIIKEKIKNIYIRKNYKNIDEFYNQLLNEF